MWTRAQFELRSIIGHDGREEETVQRLEREHDVTIRFWFGKVHMFGESKDRTEAARNAIISIIISEKPKKTDIAGASP